MNRTAVMPVAVLFAVGLAGCGGGNNASAPVTTTVSPLLQPPKPFAPIYLNIVKPARAELARFAAEASHWDGRVTVARRAGAAVPAMLALRRANRDLLGVRWPRGAAGDVEALIRANRVLDNDLGVIDVVGNVRLLPGGSWTKQFAHDAEKVEAADRIIRAHLLFRQDRSRSPGTASGLLANE
jgi:hypothetical protein